MYNLNSAIAKQHCTKTEPNLGVVNKQAIKFKALICSGCIRVVVAHKEK